jgi:hypothetical protein
MNEEREDGAVVGVTGRAGEGELVAGVDDDLVDENLGPRPAEACSLDGGCDGCE